MQHISAVVLLIAITLSVVVNAHQQKESISTVTYNERSNRLEIVHRFYIHDAEHAVKKILGKAADVISDPNTRQRFSAYVEDKFYLRKKNGEILELENVGTEIDGKFLWVYQEANATQTVDLSGIKISFFYEIWPSHVNVININYGKSTKSARLEKYDDWRDVPGLVIP